MTAAFAGPDRRAQDRRALQAASKVADDKKWVERQQADRRVAQECTGCDGRGEVGGLRADGYHSETCPFCKGSGLEGGAA